MISRRVLRQLAGLNKTPQQRQEQRELRAWLKRQTRAQETLTLLEKATTKMQAEDAGNRRN